MIERLQPTLALLDQGLMLYRRHFARFVMIAAIWFLPVVIVFGLAILFSSQIDELTGTLLFIVGAFMFFVLMIYLVVVLSRTANAALTAEPQPLRTLLRFEPLRLFGMVVFSIVYLIGAQFAASAVSLICICPAYIFSIGVVGALATFDSGLTSTGGVILVVLIFALIYGVGLFISGAVYGGWVYCLQPWAQPNARFGEALQRSIELMFYRFWRNLVTWGFASLILAAVGLAVSIAIGVALPLPLAWAFGAETPLVQAVSASAWFIGFVLVLPPLPIWMAMLYRRNQIERDGAELQAKVDTWWNHHFVVPRSGASVQS